MCVFFCLFIKDCFAYILNTFYIDIILLALNFYNYNLEKLTYLTLAVLHLHRPQQQDKQPLSYARQLIYMYICIYCKNYVFKSCLLLA